MNILNIISSVNPEYGGAIAGSMQLGLGLEFAKHRVEFASLDSPVAPFVRQTQLPVHALGPAMLGYGFGTKFVPWMRANRARYDVVIVNGLWQFHSFGAWLALHKSSTPYVLFPHGMLDPWFKKQYPLKHLKKWLYWPWADYRVLRDARAVLFTCEEERQLASSSFWLYRCNEVVVNFGTSGPACEPEFAVQSFFALYPELRNKKLALFMGRIHPKKGCDLLIEAFARVLGPHQDWHLVIAGPDQIGWRDRLEFRARELGVDSRITWTGMIKDELKWGAFQAAEAFVLPSHQENFGVVVAEALACGVPALLSNKINIWREVCADGAGIVAEDTLEGTCRLLQSYIDLPDVNRLAMREAAKSCFSQRFEVRKAVQSLYAVLAQVTGSN
jgi:glycosyltransferase involved in cell wall biosynthesis